MLKWLAFVAVSVLALWFGLVSLSPSYNDCIRDSGQHSTEHYTSDGQEIIEGSIENPNSFRLSLVCGSSFANRNGEAFTGLFTIVLSIATFLLGYLAWDQAKINKAQLRAYLSAKAQGIVLEGNILRVKVEIRNSGQTPAFNVVTPAAWQMHPPPPHVFDVKTATSSPEINEGLANYTLGRDGVVFLGLKATVVNFDLLRAQAIGERQRFYAYGRIHYTDIFGAKPSTNFCVFLEPGDFIAALEAATASPKVVIETAFKVASFGNESKYD